MQKFIQYALAVGNDKPGRNGNVGYGRNREQLIAFNAKGLYANNPQILYGQTTDRKWHVVDTFDSLKGAAA